MSHSLRYVLSLGLLVLLAACGRSNRVTVRHASATPGDAQGESLVFLTLENASDQTEVLTAVESDAAAQATLMLSLSVDRGREDEEITQPIPQVEIPPKAAFEMNPNGIFIQLSGLRQDLRPGDTIELTLHFQQAGNVKISVPVR